MLCSDAAHDGLLDEHERSVNDGYIDDLKKANVNEIDACPATHRECSNVAMAASTLFITEHQHRVLSVW